MTDQRKDVSGQRRTGNPSPEKAFKRSFDREQTLRDAERLKRDGTATWSPFGPNLVLSLLAEIALLEAENKSLRINLSVFEQIGSDCCWIGDPCPEHNPGAAIPGDDRSADMCSHGEGCILDASMAAADREQTRRDAHLIASRDHWKARAEQAERERDEWKRRYEAAMTRTGT